MTHLQQYLLFVLFLQIACCTTAFAQTKPTTLSDVFYTSSGSTALASIYGERTVVEFEKPPKTFFAFDPFGTPLKAERVGRFFRLSTRVHSFYFLADGRRADVIPRIETQSFPSNSPHSEQ